MPNTPLKQLDYNGLLYFWTLLKAKLGDKVDKEVGKGLSTNDYTTAEQTKLSGIETGAEANIIESVKVNGSALTPDANKAVDITVPTKVSDLTNDSGFVTTDTTYTLTQNQSDGHILTFAGSDQSSTTITIPDNGEVNIIEGVKVNGTLVNPDGNKIVDITVPTVVSDLTNDAGYITSADLPTNVSDLTNDADYQTGTEVAQAIEDALADITGIDFQIVQTLPASGVKGTIYLVSHGGTAPDVYDEYVWIVVSGTGSWEKIGTTQIDLSNYVQFTDLTPITNQEIDTICNT